MIVIGVAGYATSGKDSVGQVLIDGFGFTRLSFADKLRDVLYAINPLIPVGNGISDTHVGHVVRLQDVVDAQGWQDAKLGSTEIRKLLQRTGTEAGREVLGENLWVDAAFKDVHDDARLVVTDCRFWSEARGITERGGQIWRVNREGTGPINDHPSETELDDYPFDRVFENNGTLDSLRLEVGLVMEGLGNI